MGNQVKEEVVSLLSNSRKEEACELNKTAKGRMRLENLAKVLIGIAIIFIIVGIIYLL